MILRRVLGISVIRMPLQIEQLWGFRTGIHTLSKLPVELILSPAGQKSTGEETTFLPWMQGCQLSLHEYGNCSAF